MTEREKDRNAARRLAIIRHAQEDTGNVSRTCRYYGITRQAYYKWLRRYGVVAVEVAEGFPFRLRLLARVKFPKHVPLTRTVDPVAAESILTWRLPPASQLSVAADAGGGEGEQRREQGANQHRAASAASGRTRSEPVHPAPLVDVTQRHPSAG